MTQILDLDLELELREDANAPDGSIGYVYGRAVPYDTPTNIGGVEESFAPGAFEPTDVIGKPLNWRHGEPIGVIVSAANEPDGLYIGARILDTVQGRDAAVLTRAKAVKGLSVGFIPTDSVWDKARTKVRHVLAQLAETSLTPNPAYATAGVSVVREETPMSETTMVETTEVSAPTEDREAREALAEVRNEMHEIRALVDVAGREALHPLAQFRSFGEYAKAVLEGGIESRALTAHDTADEPGIMPPNWMTDIKKVTDFGRPAINALGIESAGSSGLEFNWPYLDTDLSTLVDAQSAENAEVNSVLVELKKASATLATYAGAGTMSYQLLQRSNPSFLQQYMRFMAIAYAIKTDSVFGAALLTASTAQNYNLAADTDGADFRAGVFEASVAVESATGSPASVVLVASDVFLDMGAWTTLYPAQYGTNNVPGTADAASLNINISGLRIIHDRNLASGTILVTNGTAASWIEDGPRVVNQDVVSTLSQNAAIYGYGVTAVYNAAGVISLEVVA